MKRIIVLMMAIAVLLSLFGCAEANTEEEITTEKSTAEKGVIDIEISYAEPNYDFQLYRADEVIEGEVIEELESYYSNPDREIEGLMNALITPYVVRVGKAYKGGLSEGDEVIVTAWNEVGIYPGDKEEYTIVTNERKFYLHEGQKAVFLLSDRSEDLARNENETIYEVVYQNEGVFDLKNEVNTSKKEESKVVYASPSFEMTLDRLPDDIKKAEEKFKDVYSDDKGI